MDVEILLCRGDAVTPYLPAVAALRCEVFRQWPYLYAGDAEYEARYLAAYARSAGSLFVLARDGDSIVGASTGIPLADDDGAFQQAFVQRGLAVAQVFYCGESVLRESHRGRGLGHRFFDERERHARQLGGFAWTAFCAVDREADDPRRPPGHRGNEAFWSKRGYRRQPDMQCRLDWPEVDAAGSCSHTLTYWLRDLT